MWEKICRSSNIGMARYLYESKNLTKNIVMKIDIEHPHANIFRCVHMYGDLKMLKYVIRTFKLTRPDIVSNNNSIIGNLSCDGQLEMLEYLTETFKLTRDDARCCTNYALGRASANGHFEVVKYLVQTFKLTKDDIIYGHGGHSPWLEAVIRERRKIMRYFKDTFELTHTDIMRGFDSWGFIYT